MSGTRTMDFTVFSRHCFSVFFMSLELQDYQDYFKQNYYPCPIDSGRCTYWRIYVYSV